MAGRLELGLASWSLGFLYVAASTHAPSQFHGQREGNGAPLCSWHLPTAPSAREGVARAGPPGR